MNKLYLTSVCILLFFVACKKSSDNEAPQNLPDQGTIKGSLNLPSGTTYSPNTLTVQSPITNGSVTNGSFNVTGFLNRHTTEFVVNINQEVVMMGYHYPGQASADISAASTALALVMNSQSILFLSEQGKKAIADKVLTDVNFPALVTVVEASIKANKNIFDETNDLLLQKVSAVFTSVSQRVQRTQGEEAVLINKVGNTLNFQNNSNANSAVVGIYKDGSRVKKIVVEGLQYVPTSVSEVFNGYSGISADPVQYPYTFSGNGNYEIKVRSGRPGAGDGSVEHNEAFYENLSLASYNVMCIFYPLLKTSGCNKATILTSILGFLMSAPDILASKNAYAAIHDAFSLVFQNLDFAIGDCIKKGNGSYFTSLAKAFNFIDKAFSVTGTTANITFFSKHWTTVTPVWDTCMIVEGNTVTGCLPVITTSIVDSITNNSAWSGGDLLSEGGSSVTEKGLCWSTSPNPTTANLSARPTSGSTGAGGFNITFKGLAASTTYYVRAYAKNKYGVYYGNQRSFKTLQ